MGGVNLHGLHPITSCRHLFSLLCLDWNYMILMINRIHYATVTHLSVLIWVRGTVFWWESRLLGDMPCQWKRADWVSTLPHCVLSKSVAEESCSEHPTTLSILTNMTHRSMNILCAEEFTLMTKTHLPADNSYLKASLHWTHNVHWIGFDVHQCVWCRKVLI